MNDFERRDDRLDNQVQIEHLDPLDTFQEKKLYRIFQLLGFLWRTHRWGRRGILMALSCGPSLLESNNCPGGQT